MHKRILSVFALFFISVPYSYALVCETLAGSVLDYDSINERVAVLNSLPAGTVLWRQPTREISVRCWVDIAGRPDENIYFYINPNKQSLGPELEIGVTFEGKDHLASTLPNGKLDTGWTVTGCAATGVVCGSQKETKRMTYSLFFIKKSPSGDSKEGPLTTLNNYRAFQFDGVEDVRPGWSYSMTISGLENLSFIPCESLVSILPSVINFGTINASDSKVGKTIKEIPFTINEQRTCTASYGINGYIEPLQGSLSSGNTLIPNDNKSVGINIIDSDSLKALDFKKEFVLTPKTTSTNNSHQFSARLKWMDEPVMGAFEAGAIVNIFYK